MWNYSTGPGAACCRALLGAAVAAVCLGPAGDAGAQRIGRRVQEFDSPKTTPEKMQAMRREYDHVEQALKANVRSSMDGPFVSAQSVVKSETVVERSRLFGAGEPSMRAKRRPTQETRAAAITVPERNYPGKASEQAVAAAAFAHLLSYRDLGFAKDARVEFLAVGDRLDDPEPSLLKRVADALPAAADPDGPRRALLPASRAMDVPDDGFLDRMSGARGPVYRVTAIEIANDGTAEVVASFSEKNGHFFTKVFGLEQDPRTGWRVVSERDF